EGISDVYFDFDRYEIKSDERAALEKSARVLKEDKKIKILIEGHADERGSSEYNIALGERRADAAKKYLVNLGVDSRRMSTVSYGKEKPFCFDSTEECWQENRRAHFVISD
ncbi:MAG TPA: peptidoglycan-associated lipoprotein Pal, partial [Thermodesulfobacteriota bacterium]|nr:peptidoglycan-associated lipoprotein Pal [Thermodesulfobacteriota bacterium]